MAAELLVIGNPGRRKARRSRARRNPTRRRAMSAKQAKYFGKRKSKRHARRSALAANPTRRRRAHAPRKARRRHMRRNPSFSLGSFKPQTFVQKTLMPAGIGAAGALALDVALGYLAPHLPAAFTTGNIAPTATKIAGAVGLGMAVLAVTKDRAMAEQVAAGAIIVTLYGAAKKMLAAQFPTVPGLSGMGVYVNGMGYPGAALAFPDRSGMGVYVAGGSGGTMPPAVAQAIAMQAARRNAAPVGLNGGGEYNEGGYQYA